MASICSARTNTGAQLCGSYSPTSSTSSPSAPSPTATSSQSTEDYPHSLSQSTKSKAWIDSRKFLTTVLSVTSCGVTHRRERLALSSLQEEQGTSLARRSSISICTIMDLLIWREPISCAQRDTNSYSRMHFQRFGQLPTPCTAWATWPPSCK